jgi:hypothetical protein
MERKLALRAQTLRVRRTPTIVVGLGPIGLELSRLLLTRPELFQLASAADPAPHLVGRTLRALLGRGAPAGRVQPRPPRPRGRVPHHHEHAA